MQLDSQNIQQLMQILTSLQPLLKTDGTSSSYLGKNVIVRTRDAGVHFGILASHQGLQTVLHQARRIYSWQGANTLNEISLHGVQVGSKLSEPVPEILLTETIEILPMSNKAVVCMMGIGWAK